MMEAHVAILMDLRHCCLKAARSCCFGKERMGMKAFLGCWLENEVQCACLLLPIFLNADIRNKQYSICKHRKQCKILKQQKQKPSPSQLRKRVNYLFPVSHTLTITQAKPISNKSPILSFQKSHYNPASKNIDSSTPDRTTQFPAASGQCFYAAIQHISFLGQQNYNFYFYHEPYNFTSFPFPTQITPFIPVFPEISKEEREKPHRRRKRSERKERESAKKNSESNIINQLYSHLTNTQRSQNVVDKIIDKLGLSSLAKGKQTFYSIVRLINFRRGRRYVNKENILSFYFPQDCIEQLGQIASQLDKKGDLTLQNFCTIFRACTYHFLREEIITAVLTSKRIFGVAGLQHLRRRRIIAEAMELAPQ